MANTQIHHDRMRFGDIKLFAGTACPELAQKIADQIGVPLCERDIIEFPNGNLFVKLKQCSRTGLLCDPNNP